MGGFFSGANSIGGQPRNFIARLDATTGLADSFNPTANGSVLAIAVQADGKILAGGGFTTLSPNGGATVTRNHIGRLEADGRLDQTLNLSIVVGSSGFGPLFSPPPFSRTARFSSAAGLPPFWAWRATTLHD